MKTWSHLMVLLALLSAGATSASAAPPAKGAAKPAAKASPAKKQATGATKSPAASAGSSAEFNNYANALRQKMGTNWPYPSGKNHVTLTIQVAQDGSVTNLALASTPKNTEAEQKANDAFNSAQPLQALPAGVTEATITAVFDSQADQWDSKANIAVKIDPSKTAAPADSKSPDATTTDSDKKEEDKK